MLKTRWRGVESRVTDSGMLTPITFSVTENDRTGCINFSYIMMGDDPVNITTCNATFTTSISYPKGDLDHDWMDDDDDTLMMLRASAGDITTSPEYGLNGNGVNVDVDGLEPKFDRILNGGYHDSYQ